MGKNKSKKPCKTIGARQSEENYAQKEGKKNYSISQNESCVPESDEKLKRVTIPPYLEKELLRIIQDARQNRPKGDVSTRFTAKKLLDMYTSLQLAGFQHTHIEQALRNSVPYGGDVIDALDWLCLNIHNDELPDGFSNTFREEQNKKSRGQFEGSQVDMSRKVGMPLAVHEEHQVSPNAEIVKDDQVGETKASNMKSWILQYADHESGSSDDGSGADDGGGNPNDQYTMLSMELCEAKSQAAEAKQDGDKVRQKLLSKTIQQIMEEMKILEKDASFLPSTKDKCLELDNAAKLRTEGNNATNGAEGHSEAKGAEGDVGPKCDGAKTNEMKMNKDGAKLNKGPKDVVSKDGPSKPMSKDGPSKPISKDAGGVDGDEGMMGFGLMEEMVLQAKDDSVASAPKPKIEARSFEYTRQQWTGKSPKQFLLDWCSKHLGNAPKPKFTRKDLPRNLYKFRLTVHRPKDVDIVVLPDIACHNVKEAEHLASTQALYVLCKGQSVHQLLPPPYRDIWVVWLSAEKKASVEAQTQTNKPRDEMISRLMKDLSIKGGTATGGKEEEGEVDDWEMLADLDEIPTPTSTPHDTSPHKDPHPHQIGRSTNPSKHLLDLLQSHMTSSTYHNLLETRKSLPVFSYRDMIIQMVRSNRVLVVSGETGSGKSTQIPQFILQGSLTEQYQRTILSLMNPQGRLTEQGM